MVVGSTVTNFGWFSWHHQSVIPKQEPYQFTLAARTGLGEQVPQMHSGRRRPDSEPLAALFQRTPLHEKVGQAPLGECEAVELAQIRLQDPHWALRILDKQERGRLVGIRFFAEGNKWSRNDRQASLSEGSTNVLDRLVLEIDRRRWGVP